MKEITSPVPHHLLGELYKLPNQAGIRSIIEKTCRVYMFSEHVEKYIFLKTTDAYCYLVGELTENDITTLVHFFHTFPDIKLLCDERHHTQFLNHGMHFCPRVDLIYPKSSIDTPNKSPLIVRPIDTPDFGRQCPWWGFVTGLYGSEEIFFKNGFGVAICEGNTVLSAAYAACVGGGFAEIAIATSPGHEGKGMATLAAKHCINECLARNLTPEWSCNAENIGSLRVALKSGFTLNRYYSFLINGHSKTPL